MDEITRNRLYRPFMSYQVLKYIGMFLVTISQMVTLGTIYNLIFGTKGILNETWTYILSMLSVIGLPLVLIGTLSNIIYNRKKVFVYLGLYLALGIAFVFIVQLGIWGYMNILISNSGLKLTTEQTTWLGNAIITALGKFQSLNIFMDLFLVALFYLFMFYKPKKIDVKLFRWGVLIPIAYLITSYILNTCNKFGVISLNFYGLSFLVSKKPSAYAIFLSMLIYLKIFNKETEEGDFNVDSFDFSIFMSLAIVFISIIDAFFYFIPNATKFGFGDSYCYFMCVPFVLCYDYNKEIKHPWIGFTMPAYYGVTYGIILYFFTALIVLVLTSGKEYIQSFIDLISKV